MHGPVPDNSDFPHDLSAPYPGTRFGPMGPLDREGLFKDVRNLAGGSETTDPIGTSSPDTPLREYAIFTVEFHRVETPFVIGLWIFFASLAKIGESFLGIMEN